MRIGQMRIGQMRIGQMRIGRKKAGRIGMVTSGNGVARSRSIASSGVMVSVALLPAWALLLIRDQIERIEKIFFKIESTYVCPTPFMGRELNDDLLSAMR